MRFLTFRESTELFTFFGFFFFRAELFIHKIPLLTPDPFFFLTRNKKKETRIDVIPT